MPVRSFRFVSRAFAASLVSAQLLYSGAPLHAQSTASDNQTLAEVLFREGQKLVESGKYSEACPKFAESQRLDPGTGTLLNLALCHEKEGRTASAWTEFRQAAGEARTAGRRDRLKMAEDHIAKLEPQLSKVVIQLAPEVAKENPEVHFDSISISRAAWGVAIPADPGTHQVRVGTATKSWKSTVEVPPRAALVTVTVPALNEDGAAPVDAAPKTPEKPPASASTNASTPTGGGSVAKTAVLVVEGLVTVGGLALGIVYAGKASSAESDADNLRARLAGSDPNPCRAGGSGSAADCASLRSNVDDSTSASHVAIAGFVAGGVGAVALAATWLLWKPSGSSTGEIAITPMFAAGTTGVAMTWRPR
jgi:TolA-binding protein